MNHQESGSRPKGKEADPRNWGGVSLTGNEMDLEVQRQLLESYNARLEGQHNLEGEDLLDVAQDYEEGLEMSSSERRLNRRMEQALLLASREIEESERHRAEKRGREYMAPREFEENKCYLLEQLNAEDLEATEEVANNLGGTKIKKRKSKASFRKKKNSHTEAMKPTAQITGESALGRAFGRIRDLNGSDPSEDSSSSDGTESSDETYSGT
ncbi:hypothetical protein C0993_003299 [Termitomyces sp. T159_Od127]|nr:hypothetical protein C0993_003299 [Termitomyces sp. T159_Od127]